MRSGESNVTEIQANLDLGRSKLNQIEKRTRAVVGDLAHDSRRDRRCIRILKWMPALKSLTCDIDGLDVAVCADRRDTSKNKSERSKQHCVALKKKSRESVGRTRFLAKIDLCPGGEVVNKSEWMSTELHVLIKGCGRVSKLVCVIISDGRKTQEVSNKATRTIRARNEGNGMGRNEHGSPQDLYSAIGGPLAVSNGGCWLLARQRTCTPLLLPYSTTLP